MQVRELLQTEIWSKRTSRRILVVIGIIAFVGFSFFEIDGHWISWAERKTARAALTEIDALQSFGSMSEAEYKERLSHAKGTVEAADKAGWTRRDLAVSSLLSAYLSEVEIEKGQVELTNRFKDSKNENLRQMSSSDSQMIKTGTMVRDYLSKVLHRVLR
jgi:hypothetical protein